MPKAEPSATRRAIMRAAALGALIGAPIPFGRFLPEGLSIVADAYAKPTAIPGKTGLTELGDRPIVLETPPHLLDDALTPANRFFVRNNGQMPDLSPASIANWRLSIDGAVETPLTLSLADLKRDFESVTRALVIECAGNGRKFFRPATNGNAWTFGGVGCASWTGVRLKDVLTRAKLKPSARYTGHYGADAHLSGDPAKTAISRGVPIEKALEEHTIIAWAMNGQPMPAMNGHPLRLVVPGWPGSCSQKWLNRIRIRDREHDGEKMGGSSYRLPRFPIAPGAKVADEDMEIITSMPVKSLITFPQTGARVSLTRGFEVRGHAWSGEVDVAGVDVSIDFGQTWRAATLEALPNKYAWRRFRARMTLPEAGYYEVWARARDANGVMQPAVAPGWNPQGYNNNQQHRIGVFAA